MDINKYALFADVAETKNFTKSGERLGYTQPGVSHVLKVMEEELGFPLFLRTKQGMTLTSNAAAILPLVRNLLNANEQLTQTINALNGLDAGHLAIASFASIARNWLPAMIHRFQQEYPNIEIELLEGGADEIVGWVESNRADFGLLSRRHIKSLEWIGLREDPLMAILPADYEERGADTFDIAQMNEQPFIISASGVDYDIHYALDQAHVTPRIHFSSKDDSTIISMVSNHLGVSILPQLILNGISIPVKALPLNPYCARELGIGIRSRQELTPAARHFIEIIHETLAG